MPQETETYSAETPFSEFLSDTMSGANTVSEYFPEPPSDSSSSDAAGAPPAGPSDGTGSNPTSPEGAQPTTSTETPLVNTSEPSSAPVSDPDPLKDATPLTYTVNGQSRTFDDIKVIPGVGGVIEASALENLTRRLTERDNLFERSQQQYQQVQALERLMTWTQTGQDGKPIEVTGPQAIESMRLSLGAHIARNLVLEEALSNPEVFASLVGVDANNRIVLNQTAFEHLGTRAQLAQMNAEKIVRSDWAARNAPQHAPPATLNIAQNAPVIAAHWAKQFGGGVLQDPDIQFLATQVPRYVRPATAEDVQADPTLKIGDPVMDATFNALVSDRAELRKSAKTQVEQAGSIAKENSAKLTAALLPNGKAPGQPNNTQRPVTRQTPKPPSQAQTDRDDLFLKMERAAAGAM